MYTKKHKKTSERAVTQIVLWALIAVVEILIISGSAIAETPPTEHAPIDEELLEQDTCELVNGIRSNPPQECSSNVCTETWQQRLGLASKGDNSEGSPAPQMLRIMPLDEVIMRCQTLTSSYTWEDENDPKSGGPGQANDCKDFANGFRACMAGYGYGSTDYVKYLHLSCYGCDSQWWRKHRINVVRRGDYLWCPIEPQANPFLNETRYGACCRETEAAAAECANKVYCTFDRKQEKLCCKPFSSNVVLPILCPTDSSWCQDSSGAYVCPPNPSRCPKRGPTPCERKIQECIDLLPPDATPELRCESCKWRNVCAGAFNNYFNGSRPTFAF